MNYRRDGNWYDTAQVCVDGHVITDKLVFAPERGENYCHECGKETISQCPACETPIRGYYHIAGVAYAEEYIPPAYCFACSAPFPWTAKTLAAVRELADELSLTDDEKEVVKERLPDIAQDTPTAQASAYKVKRLLDKAQKAGSIAAGALYKIAIDYASETTKKILTGP